MKLIYTNYVNTNGKAKESCYNRLSNWFDKVLEEYNINQEFVYEFYSILESYEDILN